MIAVLASMSSVVLGASSDGGPAWLLILGPVGAGGLYFGLWSYYRNTGKSHSFERETRIGAKPVTGADRKVNEIRGTKQTSIDGDNHDDHRERVQRLP
jgi:hypothetical protein